MSTPSNASSCEPALPTDPSQARQSGFLHTVFRRLTEIYFFGGLALVVIGASMGGTRAVTGNAIAGLGLCVAGGLCFVASAIVYSRESSKQP